MTTGRINQVTAIRRLHVIKSAVTSRHVFASLYEEGDKSGGPVYKRPRRRGTKQISTAARDIRVCVDVFGKSEFPIN